MDGGHFFFTDFLYLQQPGVKMGKKSHNTHGISLKDLIDIPTYQHLSDSFTQLTGMTISILDLNGKILTASGWQEICTGFHRKNPETALRCLESDTVLASQTANGKKYNIYKCKNGLVDVSVPIIIEGMHMANLFTGQFFFDPPDIDFFTQQAEEFGFDKDPYLESLSRVPIFSMEKVELATSFLTDLTVLIGKTSLDRKKLIELNEQLEQRVKDRTTELTDSNERFRNLSEAAFEGIAITKNGIIIEASDKLCRMAGYQPSEIIDKPLYDFIHPDEREYVKSRILSGHEQSYEIRCLRNDGSFFPVEVQGRIFAYKGQQVRVTAVRDISDKKLAEKQIEKEQIFSESLINSLPGIMYLFDEMGHYKRWNKNFERVTGYSAEDISNLTPLDTISTDDREKVSKRIKEVFNKGRASVEARIFTRSGQIIPYYLTGAKFDVDGMRYLVGIGLDITDKKQVEIEKENLISKLQDALSQVKKLSGFLPICASCKKVRDDQGYWNQIETYIKNHSEAEFSHGICPDCAKKLYPQLVDEKGNFIVKS